MLTVRSLIAATVAVAVISLAAAAVSLSRPPDSGGLAADTFGVRSFGQRGLYETLEELEVPVERLLAPPVASLEDDVTMVFVAPRMEMVEIEPAHLHAVGQWVREGGRVVVAPALERSFLGTVASPESPIDVDRGSVLRALGLPQMEIESWTVVPGAMARLGAPRDAGDLMAQLYRDDSLDDATAIASVDVSADGAWAPLGEEVSRLAVAAAGVNVLEFESSQAAGTLGLTAADGTRRVIAATFALGEGEVVVVGDPRLFENRFFDHEDNAVLALRLLDRPGRRTVFDEYYHGLSVHGNPLWLLTRPPVGMLAVAALAASGLWIWRQGRFLGPPLAEPVAPRRSITEYIEAMARFIRRARGGSPFILREVHDGVLWHLRHRLGLRPGQESAEAIAAALVRRDAAAASRLVAAAQEIEWVMSHGGASDRELVRVVKGMSACL